MRRLTCWDEPWAIVSFWRGAYDPGYLPSHWKSEWLKTLSFPDDAVSYWSYFTLPFDRVTIAYNDDKAVWAKMIGERPSFWRRDARIHKSLGVAICSGLINSPPEG